MLGLKARYKLKLTDLKITTTPVALGYTYSQKLEHLSDKKIAARSIGGGYVSKTLAPTAGKKHGGGQKVGEYDIYSLLSWDCPTIIDEFFGPLAADHATKNEMVAEIVHTGKTTFREAKTNPVRDILSQYMLAIHLESE